MSKGIAARGFDFHCHVDLYPDPVAMIAACEKNQIVTFAVTTTPKAWPQNRKWTAQSAYVHAAVGLHPGVVSDRYLELPLLEEYVKRSRLVGEIGLDGSPQHRRSWDNQVTVFVRALTVAQCLGRRVVSIHSRRAANEVVKCLAEHVTQDRVLPILHWFSGSLSAARRAAELGCYFSVNPRMLEHDAGIALVRSLPEDRLLTETDGPFTSLGERRSEPTDPVLLTDRLAETKRLLPEAMNDIIRRNGHRVLAFAGLLKIQT